MSDDDDTRSILAKKNAALELKVKRLNRMLTLQMEIKILRKKLEVTTPGNFARDIPNAQTTEERRNPTGGVPQLEQGARAGTRTVVENPSTVCDNRRRMLLAQLDEQNALVTALRTKRGVLMDEIARREAAMATRGPSYRREPSWTEGLMWAKIEAVEAEVTHLDKSMSDVFECRKGIKRAMRINMEQLLITLAEERKRGKVKEQAPLPLPPRRTPPPPPPTPPPTPPSQVPLPPPPRSSSPPPPPPPPPPLLLPLPEPLNEKKDDGKDVVVVRVILQTRVECCEKEAREKSTSDQETNKTPPTRTSKRTTPYSGGRVSFIWWGAKLDRCRRWKPKREREREK